VATAISSLDPTLAEVSAASRPILDMEPTGGDFQMGSRTGDDLQMGGQMSDEDAGY
jgi:hypothetical protein